MIRGEGILRGKNIALGLALLLFPTLLHCLYDCVNHARIGQLHFE